MLTAAATPRSFSGFPPALRRLRPSPRGAPCGGLVRQNNVSTEQLSKRSSAGAETPPPPGEFRRYRRFVSWFILAFVFVGSTYMLLSVAMTIYRRQHAVPMGNRIGATATQRDAESCFDELSDVVEGLLKYLENSHTLLEPSSSTEVQAWAIARAP